jgi:alkylhydroperoxidase family enzyme
MTDEQLKELIAVMGFANANNRMAAAYQVEIDDRFKV